MKYVLLNLPNPLNMNIYREFAGGFGTLGSVSSEILLPSYFVYGASAIERSGQIYETLDAQALKYSPLQVIEAVKRIKPDILITWVSLPSLHYDLKLLRDIKNIIPQTFTVALGTVCNVIPEEILRSGVDIVINGNYPHYNLILNMIQLFKNHPLNQDTFELLPGCVYLKNDEIVQSSLKPPYENLDELSLQIYRSLPLNEYIGDFADSKGRDIKCIPIVTSVGCPYRCMYCPYPLGYGKKVIHKSIDKILDEIEFLSINFDIQGFVFRDQLFTYNKERVERLCDEIIIRDLDIKWLVEARADQVNYELLSKMRDAGCFRVHYGVETGAPEMLTTTGKPGLNLDKIIDSFQMTKELGIFTVAHMIIGLPGETNETLKDSLDILFKLNPDSINLNIATPYPGTNLFNIAKEKGWISTYDWKNYTSFNVVMRTQDLNVDQLIKANREIRNKFFQFKVLRDSNYRRHFIRNLPRKICNRMIFYKNRGLDIAI